MVWVTDKFYSNIFIDSDTLVVPALTHYRISSERDREPEEDSQVRGLNAQKPVLVEGVKRKEDKGEEESREMKVKEKWGQEKRR